MVLHIIIHSDDQVSLCMIHGRHDRIVLSEILGKVDSLDIRMLLCQCMDRIPCSISGIIVDQHKFTLVVLQFLKFFYSQFYHFADGMFRIIAWYDNGYQHVVYPSFLYMFRLNMITPARISANPASFLFVNFSFRKKYPITDTKI